MQKHAIFLMGPTAVGKTAVAMQLAQKFPVDLISVDSALVYKGMSIGTGKPSAEELARFPHKLIDICDPSQPYSAAQFCLDATQAMQQSWQQQRIPLLVGGTMLYFKALQFGLSALPTANEELRAGLLAQAQAVGWPAMHAKLVALDSAAAERFNPNDAQRIQRALEINILTGKTLQENFQKNLNVANDYKIHAFAIMPEDRLQLHAKIAQRFDQMLAAGLEQEVQQLFVRKDLHADLPAIRAVGYRQMWAYLQGKIDHATMREQAIAATRQLAKRQYTWLRHWPTELSTSGSAAVVSEQIALLVQGIFT